MDNKKIKLKVEMDVTISQAITLTEMFKYWRYLGHIGSSKEVSFYVDGDGPFQPNCKIETSEELPVLEKEILDSCFEQLTTAHGLKIRAYDFDSISSALRDVK